MVTLLGFFFIVANVILVEVFIPDLVGPVCIPIELSGYLVANASYNIGSYLALLQLCLRRVDVLDTRQRRWQAGQTHRDFEWAGGTVRVRTYNLCSC